MTAAGIIFSNIHDESLPELTRRRTMASVPFGGRYRLIDFALSNMVNSGISKVGVITHDNYQSLLDHIGTGKDWDLARRSGGIKILPPFITAYDSKGSGQLYNTRLEALMGVVNFISRCTEELIVLSDCDTICNIDLSDVIEKHIESAADLTIVVKRIDRSGFCSPRHSIIVSDSENKITDAIECSDEIELGNDISTNIMVINRLYLLNALSEAAAHGHTSFFRDIVAKNVARRKFRVYRFDGYYSLVNSLAGFYDCSMQLLNKEVREALFGVDDRPIYTKVRNSSPTIYRDGSSVKNTLIADGCIIEGTVENSIIFRGVKVAKGSTVRNSILLQDTVVGSGVLLNCVITDKNAVIRDGRQLSGHSTMPFFIGKGMMV